MKVNDQRLLIIAILGCLALVPPEMLQAAVCLPQSSAAGVNNSGVTTGVGNQSGGANVNIGDNTQPPPSDATGGPGQTTAPSGGASSPPSGGVGDSGGGKPQGSGGGYDPTRDPGMGGGTGGSGQPVDPNVGDPFQGQTPGGGRKPPSDGGMGGDQPVAQPPGYTSPAQPPGDKPDGTTGPYVPGPAGYCPEGYYLGHDNVCRPAPACPHNWVRGHDGICHPAGGLLPPPGPGDGHTGGSSQPGTKPGGTSSGGSSQPGTGGPCPPGCHLKPDGSGQCHCGGN